MVNKNVENKMESLLSHMIHAHRDKSACDKMHFVICFYQKQQLFHLSQAYRGYLELFLASNHREKSRKSEKLKEKKAFIITF